MKKKKSLREKGNDFQVWIRNWLRDRGWIVRNFPMTSRKITIPDPKRPGWMKEIWLPQDNDVFGCDLIARKGIEILWIQATIGPNIQRKIDKISPYFKEIGPQENIMIWVKRINWISIKLLNIHFQGIEKPEAILLPKSFGRIKKSKYEPEEGFPEWYFGEKIAKIKTNKKT